MKKPPSTPVATASLNELLGDVTPLAAPKRAVHARRKPKPVPRQQSGASEAAPDGLSDHVGSEVGSAFLRSGLATQTLRKLRRGHWRVEGELDLHGLTSAQARVMLAQFLDQCHQGDVRCVRIVHGKGLRSQNAEPVLKTRVANWLTQREEVLAYCEPREAEGGAGAVVVLLKAAAGRGRSVQE